MVFPEGFLWGVSNSGFQFEMGDLAGRNIDSNTDWYAWVHDAVNIQRGTVSGDLPENGVDYWSFYMKDHRIARKAGLNAYRIGVEWSRIFPESTSLIQVGVEKASDGNIAEIMVDDAALESLEEVANSDALNHYRAVIEDLRVRDFKVFVCLNHFTLPLWIHDPITVRDSRLRKGPKGWVDEGTVIEFTKYAAYVAWKLGDIVDKWATFNEPMVISETGYLIPESGFPPALNNFRASRKAAMNMAVAHARAYDAMKRADTVKADDDSYNPAAVGLIHNIIPAKPLVAESGADVKAAEFMNHMHNHFFLESVCNGWLDRNFNGVRDKGEVKSYTGQRLDWLGVNYYTRLVVKGRKSRLARLFAGIPVIPEMVQNYGFGCKPNSTSVEGRPTSDSGWEIYPEGMLEALKLMERYGRPLHITENGTADAKDALRPKFLIDHLKVLDRAINEDKLDIRGYFHWSLTDNYEWTKGFSMKFGLYSVDLKTKMRRERKSAKTYREIIEAKR
ncbi:MAG: beta-galactosidase BgaS [Candidatus Bathyarchaeota archaeon]|nr:beta-galactosidase BgaS [Candidatus Bathyarchaeota archaeon]